MVLLNILHFPDERLRRVAKPVTEFTDEIRGLVDDMFETMYEAPGIGLAAVQVNIDKRIIVVDVSEDKTQPLALINPEIIHLEGIEQMDEGCLSVPGVFEKVERADQITVKAFDAKGEAFQMDADGLLAVCIQHEIDHLDGKLFIDYLSQLKRQRIRKKLGKQQKISAEKKNKPDRKAI